MQLKVSEWYPLMGHWDPVVNCKECVSHMRGQAPIWSGLYPLLQNRVKCIIVAMDTGHTNRATGGYAYNASGSNPGGWDIPPPYTMYGV